MAFEVELASLMMIKTSFGVAAVAMGSCTKSIESIKSRDPG
jgi:hypothetical protein